MGVINTVVSCKENEFFPVKCMISQGKGEGGWLSVKNCEIRGRVGKSPKKVSYPM